MSRLFTTIGIIARDSPPETYNDLFVLKGQLYLDTLTGQLYQSDREGSSQDVEWTPFGVHILFPAPPEEGTFLLQSKDGELDWAPTDIPDPPQ